MGPRNQDDGYRMICWRDGDRVRVFSRHGQGFDGTLAFKRNGQAAIRAPVLVDLRKDLSVRGEMAGLRPVSINTDLRHQSPSLSKTPPLNPSQS
jgi:hypothetical protein